MKPHPFALLFMAFVLLPGLTLHADGPRETIDRLMNAYYKCGQFNGVILVKQGDQVIYERAFGLANREWNVANTPTPSS